MSLTESSPEALKLRGQVIGEQSVTGPPPREDLPQRNYQGAEASFYVLGGEAIVRLEGKDQTLQAGGYATIPRGVPFTIGRRGNKALSLLSVLSGEPCEEAR